MEDNIVPFKKAKESKSDSEIMIAIDDQISKLKNDRARKSLKDAWMNVSLMIFSCYFSTD